MKRRDFIKHLPIGVAAASIPVAFPGFTATAFGRNPLLDALLNAQAETNRVLVLINLSGGNDGLNTCIPFQDPLYDQNRPKVGYISPLEKATLQNYLLRPDMALNPQMDTPSNQSKVMKLWKDGKFGIVQNVGYNNGNRSHFRSTDIWNTASDSNLIVSTGWVGRYLENERPNYPADVLPNEDPLAMSIDFTPPLTFQGSKSMMGVAVDDPSKYNPAFLYEDNVPPANNYGDELGYVRNVLIQSDIYGDRFKNLFPSTPTNNVSYPTGNRLAQQLKKVAWCISKGMKTRVYFVSQAGYDTHVQQESKVPDAGQGLLLFQLAEAISLFQQDIEAFGVADRVIGMTYSEFGRRVHDNDSAGTDHGTAAPQFFFGNEINGELYGDHPKLAISDLDQYQDLKPQYDFRQLFAAVLTDWFGASANLRKAVLNKPEFSTQADFDFRFPVNGSGEMKSLITNPAAGVTSTREEDRIFVLDQNYPNPVRSETTIVFRLSQSADVRLEVFDSRGELMATPVASRLGRGEHPIAFDARRLANGTYFYRLDVNGMVETKSMKVVR